MWSCSTRGGSTPCRTGHQVKWIGELVGVDPDRLHDEIASSRDGVLKRIRDAFPDCRPSPVRSCCLPYG